MLSSAITEFCPECFFYLLLYLKQVRLFRVYQSPVGLQRTLILFILMSSLAFPNIGAAGCMNILKG